MRNVKFLASKVAITPASADSAPSVGRVNPAKQKRGWLAMPQDENLNSLYLRIIFIIKDSVTVHYIFVYCWFMSLFAKNL